MKRDNAIIGIIGAMEIEIQGLLYEMDVLREEQISQIKFYVGAINGVNCVLAQCGIGKVNAAACTQAMILNYRPDLIINVGVAGAIAPGVDIGSLVLASGCIQHDFDLSAFGYKKGEMKIGPERITQFPCDEALTGQICEMAKIIYQNVFIGTIVTGDIFINDKKSCLGLYKSYGSLACEMESGSIAQVCYINKTPVVILRAISDSADDTGDTDFKRFVDMAAEKSQRLMRLVLPKLLAK